MIGIVGGMGPHAGIDFCALILKETLASKDQDHIPVVLSSQPSNIPDRTSYIFDQNQANPALAINEQIELLAIAGVKIVGIPCVTAHTPIIYSTVQDKADELGVSLHSIVDETIGFIETEHKGIRRIGVISTDASYHFKLYEKPIRESRFEFVDIGREKNMEYVQTAIMNEDWGIKAQSQPVAEKARSSLLRAINLLKERGAEAVILGCTELPLAFPEDEVSDVLLINPMRALARGLIRTIAPEKLKS